MDCGSWSVVGYADDGSTIVHPLSCRSWSCSRCARRNKRRLLYRLTDVKVTTLLTLTCRPSSYASPTEAFRRTSLAVNQLFKRIRRRWPGSDVQYFLVWERTKAGWPHAHLLLRAPFIPQSWLSYNWNQLTHAPIVDIRTIHQSAAVVSYIAKYLSKDPQAPDSMKRYRSSRNFFDNVLPSHAPAGVRVRNWSIRQASAREVAAELSRSGLAVAERPDGSYQAFAPSDPRALSPPVLAQDRRALQESSS